MEDIISYEQAKDLKEAGFNDKTRYLFKLDGSNVFWCPSSRNYPRCLKAPSLAQVAKWLREIKGLFIDVWLSASGYSWYIEKCSTPENRGTFVAQHDEESGDDEDSGSFTTYEKALSDGISKALSILNEK